MVSVHSQNFTFIAEMGFQALLLARTPHSLVRVSRRVRLPLIVGRVNYARDTRMSMPAARDLTEPREASDQRSNHRPLHTGTPQLPPTHTYGARLIVLAALVREAHRDQHFLERDRRAALRPTDRYATQPKACHNNAATGRDRQLASHGTPGVSRFASPPQTEREQSSPWVV